MSKSTLTVRDMDGNVTTLSLDAATKVDIAAHGATLRITPTFDKHMPFTLLVGPESHEPEQ
ncbi:hypothetical protein [Curtobacterium flaccumfaciens]|uniref:hypothetical protein n=1 Tax=Curtobacterium flaccumfaciens TaxID=2035 RepID=UPI00112A357D|nr:hypothetical protein [Curtobacterium flaccumfaciens]